MTDPLEVDASKIVDAYKELLPDTAYEKLGALSAVSIAISLKRIADSIEYQPAGGANLFDLIRTISEKNGF